MKTIETVINEIKVSEELQKKLAEAAKNNAVEASLDFIDNCFDRFHGLLLSIMAVALVTVIHAYGFFTQDAALLFLDAVVHNCTVDCIYRAT